MDWKRRIDCFGGMKEKEEKMKGRREMACCWEEMNRKGMKWQVACC